MAANGFETEQNDHVVTITLHFGQMTYAEMQEVVDECSDRIRYNNAQNFIVDMGSVEFMASACIGVLVGFLQDLEHVRGKIALANCREEILFLFKVTRLDAVFGMYDEVDQAVESF